MDTEAMDLYGRSLDDFLEGDISAKVVVHRDDGYSDEMPASVFFRTHVEF